MVGAFVSTQPVTAVAHAHRTFLKSRSQNRQSVEPAVSAARTVTARPNATKQNKRKSSQYQNLRARVLPLRAAKATRPDIFC